MRHSPSAGSAGLEPGTEPERVHHRRRRRLVTRSVAAAATIAALAGLSACSDDKDDSPDASATPAGRICDGALDEPAVAALKRLGGTDAFEELTGKTAGGQPNRFSLSRAAAHLHDGTELRSRCTVYVPGDNSGAPLVQLDFQAADKPPTRSGVEKADPDKQRTYYPLGAYAATTEENSTVLYFACPTKGKDGTKPYVDAGVFSSANQLKGHSTSKDRMVILNSVARHLAEKLGCADKAQLPSTVPDGESVTP